MANQYDTNLKLQAIADAIGDSSSSGLISALEDIADAVAGGGGGGSSAAGLVSDNFSETDTYDLGDYCIHNNTLYVCINAITTPGPWDLSDWQATNAGLELSSLNSALTKNNFDTGVDLSTYTTETNLYTCPDDGYLHIFRLTSSTGAVRVIIYPADSLTPAIAIGGSSTSTALFEQAISVRKGMRLRFVSGGSALFYKLI